jgi:arylsulfatase A-like enzyme/tetratricopeptide (TPR) repeat protein
MSRHPTSRRRALPGGAALLLATVVASLVHCTRAGKPHVVLVTLDTTRADHIGCYGSAVASTPSLDALAGEAIVFGDAVTTVPVTLPAHTSIMTGLTPLRHGVRNNGSFRLEARFHTLAEYLSFEGYETGAFVGSFILDRRFGLEQGFGAYDDRLTNERPAAETTARAIEWLESRKRSPVFLWVHYFDPHTPWTPPEPFAERTAGTLYDAEISAMDAGFGELLAALRGRGLYDRAHLIVIGDHGEGLGDHGEQEHGVFLYRECERVPFIWKRPGANAARRVDDLVGVVDILPTLLEIIGLPVPEEIEGTSLVPILDGAERSEREGLYAETLYPYYAFEWSPLHAWRTREWKYVDAPMPELYDVPNDPGERRNLAAERPELASRLQGRLDAYRIGVSAGLAIPAEGAAGSEVEERLRSLGYVSSGGRAGTTRPDTLPDPKQFIDHVGRFESGKRAMDEQRWADAAREFGAIAASMPQSPPLVTLGLGLAKLRLGEPSEAIPWLRRTMAKQPTNPFATVALGEALLLEGKAAEARELFQRYLTMRPGDPGASEGLGDALTSLGEHAAALQLYDDLDETREHVLPKTVRSLVRLRRFDDAIGILDRRAQSAAPGAKAAWTDLARRISRLKAVGLDAPAKTDDEFARQIRDAVAIGCLPECDALLDAGRRGHDAALVALLDGEVAMAKREWAPARDAFRRAEVMGARGADLFLGEFSASFELGDLDGAERALVRGIERSDDDGGYLRYNLACLLARRGETHASLDTLEAAFARGYSDSRLVRQDPDLAAVRELPEFERLMARVAR